MLLRTVVMVCGGLLCFGRAVVAQEWTRFRGPNGSGVSTAESIPVRWTEADYRWRVELAGVGHSSPVLWGRKILVTAGDEETGSRRLVCVDSADGSIDWTREYAVGKHPKHQLNSFASSTPCVDADRIYLCWATEKEAWAGAFAHDGEPLWRKPLGPFEASHGFGVSPIVVGDLVVIGKEHEGDSLLIALQRGTGETAWQVPRDTKVTYSTPCVYEPNGQEPALIFTNWKHGITALQPRSGKLLWELSVFDQGHIETAIGSPIVVGDLVLGTCGWLGYGMQTVAVRPDGGERGGVVEAYRIDRGAPLTTTPVAAHGLVFLWADNGIVTCVDAGDGKLVWRERVGGTYYGSPVVAGQAVYCLNTAGEAVVLRASKEYQLLGRNPLGDASHSTPAISGGVMYLRTFSHLMALGGAVERD